MPNLWELYVAYFWAKLSWSLAVWSYLLPVLLGLLVLYLLWKMLTDRRR